MPLYNKSLILYASAIYCDGCLHCPADFKPADMKCHTFNCLFLPKETLFHMTFLSGGRQAGICHNNLLLSFL